LLPWLPVIAVNLRRRPPSPKTTQIDGGRPSMLLLPSLLSDAAPPPLAVMIVWLIVGFARSANAGRRF
jgi:hypothetical protein